MLLKYILRISVNKNTTETEATQVHPQDKGKQKNNPNRKGVWMLIFYREYAPP